MSERSGAGVAIRSVPNSRRRGITVWIARRGVDTAAALGSELPDGRYLALPTA